MGDLKQKRRSSNDGGTNYQSSPGRLCVTGEMAHSQPSASKGLLELHMCVVIWEERGQTDGGQCKTGTYLSSCVLQSTHT